MTGLSNSRMDHNGLRILLDQVSFTLHRTIHFSIEALKEGINLLFTPIYFVHTGVMTVIMLLAFRFCSRLQNIRAFQSVEAGAERTPLLLPKDDDDVSSWGSSYDSVSHDEEEDRQEWQVLESSLEGENNSSSNNPRRLCVICYDSPRDCFFLPCGHCAACFTCGTRYFILLQFSFPFPLQKKKRM